MSIKNRKYKKVVTEMQFINAHRITELESIQNDNFDFTKLIKNVKRN